MLNIILKLYLPKHVPTSRIYATFKLTVHIEPYLIIIKKYRRILFSTLG